MMGGEDWLEWTCGVDWGPRWDENRERFNAAKHFATQSGPGVDESLRTLEINGRVAVVDPGGARLGRGIKGPYLPWRFTCDGLVYLLADRPQPHRNLPSLAIRADGRSCLVAGAHTLWQQAQQAVAILGGVIVWDRLSRVDMTLDLPNQPIAPFLAAFTQGRYVTRAKGKGYCESAGGGLTLYLGNAPPLLRIYDKLAEVLQARDPLKHALMAYHRWHGLEPDAATRIEFELNRTALKSRGINSVADYFAKRGDLIEYLCTDWARFTATKPDPTHTTRAETLDLWEQVREGFKAWAGQPTGQPLTALPREACDVGQLFRAMLGTGLTAAVLQGRQFDGDMGLRRYLIDNLTHEMDKIDWRERMRHKAATLPPVGIPTPGREAAASEKSPMRAANND